MKFENARHTSLPREGSELAEFISPPVDDRALQGWSSMIISNFNGEDLWGLTQKRPVNAAMDQRILLDPSFLHIGIHPTNDWLESKIRP